MTAPAALTRFVGRKAERAEVLGLLGSSRLVTLTGPPGVGKTRLAVEVTRHLADQYPDGIFWVDLTAIAEPDRVPAAIAAALGVTKRPGSTLAAALSARLKGRRLLLVLDGCEHLTEAAATLADTVLRRSPGCSILATSQRCLGLAAEATLVLPPLAVPGAEAELQPEELARNEAVQLFMQRAAAADPAIRLTAEQAPAVADICRRLDGLPLALELAAGRAHALSIADIAGRLDEDRFQLLSGGAGPQERHRSFEDTLRWSLELLDEPERTLLRRLSVFAGGCAVDAITEVCAGNGLARSRIPGILDRLVGSSLLLVDAPVQPQRYRLLESIRLYARDALAAAGESERTSWRHADWCVNLAVRAEPGLDHREQAAWLATLDAEHGNLRAALEWAISSGQPELGLQLSGALATYWNLRGHFREGRTWLERSLAAAGDQELPSVAKASWGAGLLATMTGDAPSALAHAGRGLALARRLGDDHLTARALQIQGFHLMCLRDPRAAAEPLEECMSLARRLGDSGCLIAALGTAGRARMFLGDATGALAYFEEQIAVAAEAVDALGTADGLIGSAWAWLMRGGYENAEGLLDRGRSLAQEHGDRYATLLAAGLLGELRRLQGDLAPAHDLLMGCLADSRAVNAPYPLGRALISLARIEVERGDLAAAQALVEEALSLPSRGAVRYILPVAHLELAEISRAGGSAREATKHATDALAQARENRDEHTQAGALHQLGRLARGRGEIDRAEECHRPALEMRRRIDDGLGIAASLEALGGIVLLRGDARVAAGILGAAATLREQHGYRRSVGERAEYEADRAALGEAMPQRELKTAWRAGAALPLGTAITRALKGAGARRRPASGWESLSPTEHDIVRLVAEGLTSAQIGQRIFLSPRTVSTHLTHIYGKLGIASRRELARAAELLSQEG